MKLNYSFKHESKQLEQELKLLVKKIKADTKELKKRYRAFNKRANKFIDDAMDSKHLQDEDLSYQVTGYLQKVNDVLYYDCGTLFDGWDNS